MLAIIHSAALLGINAIPVIIEVDISLGLPGFNLVGLPDSAVRESRERVFSAIKNAGYQVPSRRITINLAPADIRKEGTAFDLPLAIGILMASEQIEALPVGKVIILGELSLDGGIRPVHGALSIAAFGQQMQAAGLILPYANSAEASLVSRVKIFGVESLSEAIQVLQNPQYTARPPLPFIEKQAEPTLDFTEVKGQEQARRGLEIAAAGAHNFLMIGSPGCGKSLMANCLPSILPLMTETESLECTKIYSVSGLLLPGEGLLRNRPFRAPHHTISSHALVGGGTYPKPGQVSLAHHGVLFLDEMPEFNKGVLEVLRQPLEEGKVTLSRTQQTLTYPCRFMLGAALNPCPCGYAMDSRHTCTCRPEEIARYRQRLSGPLLDRIDLHMEIPSLNYDQLSGTEPGESSAAIRQRVEKARAIQRERFAGKVGLYCNAQMTGKEIREFCKLQEDAQGLLREAVETLGLSARAYDRLLKVSRTIADLENVENILDSHLAEAIHYRSLDRRENQVGVMPA